MKLDIAKEIIKNSGKNIGFRIHFIENVSEHNENFTDYFPEVFIEEPIKDEEEANKLAYEFSCVNKSRYFNIYVVSATTLLPISNYRIYNEN